MTDTSIAASTATLTGIATASQGAAIGLSFPLTAFITVCAMSATGLVTWGMFKKTTQKNETEIEMLRESNEKLIDLVSDVQQRVARIEGKLDISPRH